MCDWCNGSIPGFQPGRVGSNPISHSERIMEMKTGGYLVPASMAKDFEWMDRDPAGWAIEAKRRLAEEKKLSNRMKQKLADLLNRIAGIFSQLGDG